MQIEGLEKEKEALTKLDSLAGKGTVDLGAMHPPDPATCVRLASVTIKIEVLHLTCPFSAGLLGAILRESGSGLHAMQQLCLGV